MGTVATPGGPSISGFTSEAQIDSIISSTQPVYNTSLSDLNSANTNYNIQYSATQSAANTYESALATYNANQTTANLNALNTATAGFTLSINSLQVIGAQYSASANSYYNSAVAYITALAQKQMWDTTTSLNTISQQINNLGGDVSSFPGGAGLTSSAYNSLQNQNNTMINDYTTLLNAFNAYRYLDSEISLARVNSISDVVNGDVLSFQLDLGQATLTQVDNAQTQVNNDVSTINSLVSQRGSATTTLNNALSTYANDLAGIYNTFESAAATGTNVEDNWSTYITIAQNAAQTMVQNAYNQAQTNDQAAENAHNAAYPTLNATFTDAAVAAAEANLKNNQQSSAGIISSVATIPTLPPPGTSLSMKGLMAIITSIEVMINELTRSLSDAETNQNRIRLQGQTNDVLGAGGVIQAQDLWATIIYTADLSYDAQVQTQNENNYSTILADYNSFNNSISLINTAINKANTGVNAQLSQFNNQTNDLINQTNALGGTAAAGINAANISPPDSQNYFNVLGADPTLTPPPLVPVPPNLPNPTSTIPPFGGVSGVPAPPQLDYVSVPPTTATPAQITAFNANIESINNQLAVLNQFPSISSILLSGSNPIPLFYQQQIIPIRIPAFLQNAFGHFLSSNAFASGAASMQTANYYDVLAFIASNISSTAKGSTYGTSQTTRVLQKFPAVNPSNLGGGSGLSVANPFAPGAQTTYTINQVMEKFLADQPTKNLLEQLSLTAGLQALSKLQGQTQQTSQLGITTDEVGDIPDKDKDLNGAINTSLTNNLLTAAGNDELLLKNAAATLSGISGSEDLSSDDFKKLLSLIAALKKILLLLLASLTGQEANLPIDQVLAKASGATANQAQAFASLGLDQTTAALLAESIGAFGPALGGILQSGGVSAGDATTLSFLYITAQLGLNPAALLPGGQAQVDAAIQKLNADGIVFSAKPGTTAFQQQLTSYFQQQINAVKSNPDLLAANQNNINIAEAELGSSTNTPDQAVIQAVINAFTPPASSSGTSSGGTSSSGTSSSGTTATAGTTATTGTTTQNPIALGNVLPSEILSNLVANFQKLPPSTQQSLIAQVSGSSLLTTPPPGSTSTSGSTLTNEELAALLLATKTGALTIPQSQALLNYTLAESNLSNTETAIIQKLFTPSPQEVIFRLQEAVKDVKAKHIKDKEIQFKQNATKLYRDRINEVAQITGGDTVGIQNFIQSVSKLSSFQNVFLNYLIDPAKSIIRDFSIITRTNTDKRNQPPVMLGG